MNNTPNIITIIDSNYIDPNIITNNNISIIDINNGYIIINPCNTATGPQGPSISCITYTPCNAAAKQQLQDHSTATRGACVDYIGTITDYIGTTLHYNRNSNAGPYGPSWA